MKYSAQATKFDQFGRRFIHRLAQCTQTTSSDIDERLQFARQSALEQQKQALSPVVSWSSASQANAALALRGGQFDFFSKLGAIVPLIALVGGLLVINELQTDGYARDLADVDSALLTDDLPPAAYLDQGFRQFLNQHLER